MNNKIREAIATIKAQFAIIEAEIDRLQVAGNPNALSMTLREFIDTELLGAKRIRNFTFTWTMDPPKGRDRHEAKDSPFKTVGDMPVYHFVQFYTLEMFMCHRGVGQSAVRKLTADFAHFGIKWPCEESTPEKVASNNQEISRVRLNTSD